MGFKGSRAQKALTNTLTNAGKGALTGVVGGAMLNPAAVDSWALTGLHASLGAITGAVTGRKAHLEDAAIKARR